MRAVTTATAAAVLRVERKVLDNLLLRLSPEVLPVGRQGVERRIPVNMLPELLLVAELTEELDVPARRALVLARRLLAGEADLGAFVRATLNLDALEEEIEERLGQAIETVVRPRRGRPRSTR